MLELASSKTVWTDDFDFNTAEKNSLMCQLGSYPPVSDDWFADFLPMVKAVTTPPNFAPILSVPEEPKKNATAHLQNGMNNNMGVQEDNLVKPNTVPSLPSSATQKKQKLSRSSESSKEDKATISNKKTKSNQEQEQQTSPTLTTKGFQRHYAEHDYHDYAQVKPTQLDLQSIKASRGGVHNPFPSVLHNMMEQAEAQDFSGVVSWQPHGRAFLIHDPKAFVQRVLPKFFKHAKLSSFQRQLSLYGFIRLSHDGPDRGAYYHQCFLRGRPFLCSNIQRTRVKGTWVRTSSSPDAEPDFYRMDPVNEQPQQQREQARENVPTWLSSSNMDGAGATVEGVLNEALESITGCNLLLGEADPTPVSLLQPSSQQRPRVVTFMDRRTLLNTSSTTTATAESLKGDKTIQLNQLQSHADAGLLPPPVFPSDIVTSEIWSTNPTQSGGKAFWPTLEDCAPLFSSSKDASWSEHFFKSQEQPSLPFSVPPVFAPIRDDDELAMFLTEIDLETEMDSEFDGLVKTARV